MRRREWMLACLANVGRSPWTAAGPLAGCGVARGAGTIRWGCQTRAYGSPIRDRDRLLAVLDDLAALGYEGFETNFQSLAHSFADPAPMRREIEKRRIALIGLHASAGLFDPARLDKEHAQILEVARAVQALGGTHVILSGPQVPAGALERRARELNRAGEAVRAAGVRLAFHNHTHELEDGARHLQTILARTDPDLVSLVLDVGNLFPKEYPAVEVVRRHARRIDALHLRDTVRGQEVLIGAGEFDFAALGAALRRAAWSGWLILELNRREDLPSRQMVELARDHLRRAMRE